MKGYIALVAGGLSVITGILCWVLAEGYRIMVPLTVVLAFIGSVMGNLSWSHDQQVKGKYGFIAAMIGFGLVVVAFLLNYMY